MMTSEFCQILQYADAIGWEEYSSSKHDYKQMRPEPRQSHPSLCGFNTIYSAFQLFKIPQKITGVHGVNALSFIGNYM